MVGIEREPEPWDSDHLYLLVYLLTDQKARADRLAKALMREVNRTRKERGYIPLTQQQIEEHARLLPDDLRWE